MANKKLSAVIHIGGAVAASLKNAIGQTQAGIGRVGDAVAKLEARQRQLNQVIAKQAQLGAAGSALKVRYANQELELLDRQIAKLRQVQAAEARIGATRQANAARRASLGSMGVGATVAVASAGIPVVQAAKFETALLGVAKQMEGARDASGKLTPAYFEMGRSIQHLGREIPIATNELARMVAAGLRMGVAKDEVLQFVRNAAMMAEAFEVEPAELADQMGKIAGLYKIPIPAIGALADSINYLDDNAISKGKDIIDFLTRTGGVAGSVKVTGKEMAALGSTLLTLGEHTETASTATNAMFQKLAAADKGTKKFKSAMKEIGLSTAEVQKGMQKDALGTLMKVLTAVNKLPETKRLGVLVEMFGMEHSDTAAKLAGNVPELVKQRDMAHSDKAEGSMSRESKARLETAGAQWEIFKNKITEVGVVIGTVLLPPLNAVMDVIGRVASVFADFARDNPLLIKNIATIGAALVGLGVAKFAIIGVVWAFNALKLAVMTNPIGLLIASVVALAAVVYQNWAPLKQFVVNLWAGIKTVFSEAWNYFLTTMSWHPLALIVNNWTPIKAFFASLWDDVKNIVGAAIDWIMDKVGVVFAAIDRVKAGARAVGEAIGLAGSTAPAGTQFGVPVYDAMGNATGQTTPDLPKPAMATSKAAAPSVTNNTNVGGITIVQQPGQDTKALAREVGAELKRQDGVKSRSKMFDGANQ